MVNRVFHLIPSLGGGGAERQMAMLAAEQVRRGMEVHVGIRQAGVHRNALIAAGAKLHYVGDIRGPHPILVYNVARLIAKTAPDVLQTWLPQMDNIGGVAARLMGLPWILSERSTSAISERDPTLMLRGMLGRWAHCVVANSQAGSEYWRLRMPTSRVACIENAVDAEAIRAAEPWYAESCSETRRPTVLCVGRLHMVKNPILLLEAAALLKRKIDLNIVFVGDGALESAIVDKCKKLGLAQNVTLMSYTPKWWGLLKTSAALVSMSSIEGQPNVVVEAMAAGCPLIVSDIPQHRALLDESTARIVALGDAAALARAVSCIVEQPEEARRRSILASKRVEGMTVARRADEYEKIYELAVRRSGRRANM